MRVLLVNGSPHRDGCTAFALREAAAAIEAEGLETETFQIDTEPVRGCIGCGACGRLEGACAFGDDTVNELIGKIRAADGLIVGSPVYYASPNGALLSYLDRSFYAASRYFAYKPAAALVAARRAGTTAALDVLMKYFTIANMPVVPSQYWNMVHGVRTEDAKQDLEGLQGIRTLGRNMVWMLRCMEAGRIAGIEPPKPEKPRLRTNFIRN